ncbi:hypothetical protein [Paenibacillus sp. PL2-23]
MNFLQPVVIAFHADFVIGTPTNNGLATGTAITNELRPLLKSVAIPHL